MDKEQVNAPENVANFVKTTRPEAGKTTNTKPTDTKKPDDIEKQEANADIIATANLNGTKQPEDEFNKGIGLINASAGGKAYGYKADTSPIDKAVADLKSKTELFKSADDLYTKMEDVLKKISDNMPKSPQYTDATLADRKAAIDTLQKPVAPEYSPLDMSKQQIATAVLSTLSATLQAAATTQGSNNYSQTPLSSAAGAIAEGTKIINSIQTQHKKAFNDLMIAYEKSLQSYNGNVLSMWENIDKNLEAHNKWVLDVFKQQSANWNTFSTIKKEVALKEVDTFTKGLEKEADLQETKTVEINKGKKSVSDASMVNAKIKAAALTKIGSLYASHAATANSNYTKLISGAINIAKTTGVTVNDALRSLKFKADNDAILAVNPDIKNMSHNYLVQLEHTLDAFDESWFTFGEHELTPEAKTAFLRYIGETGTYIDPRHLTPELVNTIVGNYRTQFGVGSNLSASYLYAANDKILRQIKTISMPGRTTPKSVIKLSTEITTQMNNLKLAYQKQINANNIKGAKETLSKYKKLAEAYIKNRSLFEQYVKRNSLIAQQAASEYFLTQRKPED